MFKILSLNCLISAYALSVLLEVVALPLHAQRSRYENKYDFSTETIKLLLEPVHRSA